MSIYDIETALLAVVVVGVFVMLGVEWLRWRARRDVRNQLYTFDYRNMEKHRLRYERARLLMNVQEVEVTWPDVHPISRRSRYFGETVEVTPDDLPLFVWARALEKGRIGVPIDFEHVTGIVWL